MRRVSHTVLAHCRACLPWLVCLAVLCVQTGLRAQIIFSAQPRDTVALCQYVPAQETLTARSTYCAGAVDVVPDERRIDVTCAHSYTLIRSWTATDQCGLDSVITQRIVVNDLEAPIIIGVPANRTLRPSDPLPQPNVRAIDFCDDAPVLTYTVTRTPGPCGGFTLVHRYSATDACGNLRTAEYVLTISDEEPPEITGVTPGRRLNCGEALPAPPNVTASDNGGTPALTVTLDTLTQLGGDTCAIIRRVWTATDDCGLAVTAAQTFTQHDGTAPTLQGVPADVNVYCEALPPAPQIGVDVTASDDCSAAPTILYAQTSTQTNDGTCTDVTYDVVRTWTAIDECGNMTEASQTLHMKCECCFNGIDDDDDGLVDDYDPQCNCFSGVATECDSTKRYYLPPVWHPSEPRYNQPSELVITTLAAVANVHIMTADGTAFNANYTVVKGTPLIIPLTVDQLQTPNHDRIERDRGWVITSDQLIQPIYRVDAFYNKVLVTVKGPQAVGRVFRAGSQTNTCGENNMNTGEGHFISVMATEDDTEVTIDFTFPALNGLAGPVTRRLDRHETYLIRDDHRNSTVSGSLVTSTKPIVVTTGSQHTKACRYENGQLTGGIAPGMDGGIDQLVPNCLTGDEYVLVRGAGSDMQQYATLVANKNNTRVVLDGDVGSEMILNAGEHTQVWLDGNAFQPRHFKGNKPFYMFHTSGISANNEVGMAIAAPIGECKGDTLIDFPKFAAPTATKPVRNAVYVILPNAGLATLMINGASYTGCATARPVPSRTDWSVVTFENACLQDLNSIRCEEFFTAGMLVGIDGETGTHGYLSAFKDRMTVYRPLSDQATTGYLIDTLCGEQVVTHCVDVASCAVDHSIAAVRGGQGDVRLTGGTCFEYTAPNDFHGTDEMLVTLQNDQGLFQTVCLSYFVCAEPPEASFPFLDTVVNCDNVPPIEVPQLSDECDMEIEFDTEEVVTSGGCEYAYVIERHWTIWDDCGDSTRATQVINVQDTIAPQALDLPSDTLLAACEGIPPVPTVSFQENCDSSFQWTFRQETVDSTCSYDRTIVRTWEAWDNCGNNSTAVQRIELRDTSAPVFSQVPADVIFDCTRAVTLPLVTALDDCDPNPTLTLDSVQYAAVCDTLLHLVRTWTATDACGRVSSQSQRVLVLDLASPVVLDVPADTTILCGEPLPTTEPTFTDDCTVPVPVYMLDSTAEGSCPVVSTIYRRWVATDDCGHVTSAEQVIEIIDTLAPQFVPLPDTIFSSCLDSVVVLEPSVIESCNLTVTFTDSMAAGVNCNADRYLYRTYVATDNCDRRSEYTQLYYFQDNVPPFWVQEPNDTLLSCDEAIPAPIDPSVADACSGLNPIAMVERDSQRVCPARRWIFREYTVSDWCGNLSTFRQTITIDGCEPAIPALATAQSDCVGEDIVLRARVDSGYTTPVYLWQFSSDGTTWTDLAQPSDSTSLTLPDAQAGDAGAYRVVVANSLPDLQVADCSSTSPPVELSLNPVVTTTERIDLCRGDTLFYLGDTLTQSLTRADTLTTRLGCDSFATLELTVFPFVQWSLDTTLCFGDSLEVFGTTYTSSGTYRDTLLTAYGCDTTLALNLHVLPDLRDTTHAVICPGGSMDFEGTRYDTPGTYTAPLTSATGCDSARTIIVTAANAKLTQLDTTICAGGSVRVGTVEYDATGVYRDTFPTAQGCDSVVVLDLLVAQPSFETIEVRLCSGSAYFFGDTVLRTPGSFRQNLRSVHGCDSTVVAEVTMSPVHDVELRAELCAGQVYTNQSYSFSAPGRWPMAFYTADGCDSTVYVTLQYRPTFDVTVDVSLCSGDAYVLHDTTLTTAGTYVRTGLSRFGCDSTVTLNLAVESPDRVAIDTVLCFGESLRLAGRTYGASTRDTITLTNRYGCDSVLVLDLTVRDDISADTTALICEGEVFVTGGRAYDSTGVYRHTEPDVAGCDSTYTVYLTVVPTQYDTVRHELCAGDTLRVNGSTYTQGGTYLQELPSDVGCTLELTVEVNELNTAYTELTAEICATEVYAFGDTLLTTAGTYRRVTSTLAGCDSTVALRLTVLDAVESNQRVELCPGDEHVVGNSSYTSSGAYVDTLTAVNGCDSLVRSEVVLLAAPSSTTELTLCPGDTIEHGAWRIHAPGRYADTLLAVNGCDSVATVVVRLAELYDMSIVHTICEGEVYAFGQRELREPGTYENVFSSVHGCDSAVRLELTVVEDIQLFTEDLRMCAGESGVLEVTGYEGPVRWSPLTGIACADCPRTEVIPAATTVYTVTAIDCYGEEISATATVQVDNAVEVNIVGTDRLRLGERTRLKAVTNESSARLTWYADRELLCDNCDEVDVLPLTTTLYSVEARTTAGCEDTAQLTLVVEDACAFGEVLVPNLVTPNADGYNDVLEIRYEGIQEVSLLKIYDRWGELVYETRDIDAYWDATHHGVPVNPGVFMYYLSGFCLDGEEFTEQGNVTVVR